MEQECKTSPELGRNHNRRNQGDSLSIHNERKKNVLSWRDFSASVISFKQKDSSILLQEFVGGEPYISQFEEIECDFIYKAASFINPEHSKRKFVSLEQAYVESLRGIKISEWEVDIENKVIYSNADAFSDQAWIHAYFALDHITKTEEQRIVYLQILDRLRLIGYSTNTGQFSDYYIEYLKGVDEYDKRELAEFTRETKGHAKAQKVLVRKINSASRKSHKKYNELKSNKSELGLFITCLEHLISKEFDLDNLNPGPDKRNDTSYEVSLGSIITMEMPEYMVEFIDEDLNNTEMMLQYVIKYEFKDEKFHATTDVNDIIIFEFMNCYSFELSKFIYYDNDINQLKPICDSLFLQRRLNIGFLYRDEDNAKGWYIRGSDTTEPEIIIQVGKARRSQYA